MAKSEISTLKINKISKMLLGVTRIGKIKSRNINKKNRIIKDNIKKIL